MARALIDPKKKLLLTYAREFGGDFVKEGLAYEWWLDVPAKFATILADKATSMGYSAEIYHGSMARQRSFVVVFFE